MKFPKVKNTTARSISDDIQGIQPSEGPSILKTYKDHMGNHVTVFENGRTMTHSYSSTQLYGGYGHSFGQGYFIVDENGEMVFAGDERYDELMEKCRDYWKVMRGLKERFPEYQVEASRGERLSVNDKIIKGILVYPGMRMAASVEAVINSIAEFIQNDIDNGRIVKGEYGI
jgi:hypothetical protein